LTRFPASGIPAPMDDRSIPRSDDYADSGDSIENTADQWMGRVLQPGEATPETERVGVRLPIRTTVDDLAIPDEHGKPIGAGKSTVVERDVNAFQQLWRRKQRKEPCYLCKHFVPRFSPEQKAQIVEILVKEHGWTEELVTLDLGDLRNYEFCDVYKLLTHRMASCPRHFVPKD